jgi:hypothetical protein
VEIVNEDIYVKLAKPLNRDETGPERRLEAMADEGLGV